MHELSEAERVIVLMALWKYKLGRDSVRDSDVPTLLGSMALDDVLYSAVLKLGGDPHLPSFGALPAPPLSE